MSFHPEDRKSDKTARYTFRTAPKLLKDLKNYANAKNTTIPTLINDYFEELLKGRTLTREQNTNFTIPFYALSSIEHEEETEDFKMHGGRWFEKMGYVFFNNCLDVWEDDTYKSSNPEMKHEGLAILKQTVHKDNSLETAELVFFVKIEQYLDDTVFAYTIWEDVALNLAEQAKNYILIEKVKKNIEIVNKTYQKIQKFLESNNKSDKTKCQARPKDLVLTRLGPDIMKENRRLRSENKRLEKELEKYKNLE